MYKDFKAQRYWWVVALLTIITIACKHDNLLVPKPNENIRPAADFIRNNYDFRLFYAALDYTGLVNELNGKGPFTILAIPDKAFKLLGVLTEDQVRRLNKDSLQRALRYHVLKNRRLLSSDVPTNGIDIRYETLSGDSVYTSILSRADEVYIDGVTIVRKNIPLSNGILHVVSKPLQYHKGETIKNYLSRLPEYSIYVAGLKKFGLLDELANKGPFTIFAPNNEALTSKGITMETIDTLTTAAYYGNRLFGAYILYGKHFFISDMAIFGAITGENIYNTSLRNDNWILRLATVDMKADPADNFTVSLPILGLFNPGKNPANPDRIGEVIQRSDDVKPPVWYDHRCENGIVHQLHGALATPADVLK
ncbi:fasciclin domain-containing protein [Chitinophaga pendula]|uniref:fasciclin domain-containing protein n=1 Tax=Chitinophaga TaxID=79328 RepID=UPI000BB06A77|nr:MULTISPECIES: fasciclin domain-containing protein [Chitinophaga]ASZ09651.1 hypothetical protein CK934_01005 [Chitinophaga sp. MD30]UCJ07416.1 fasciclin domain-containing protein [Chitinophaga pendula]